MPEHHKLNQVVRVFSPNKPTDILLWLL